MKLMFSIFFIQNLDLFSYILENCFFFLFFITHHIRISYMIWTHLLSKYSVKRLESTPPFPFSYMMKSTKNTDRHTSKLKISI